MAYSQVTPIAGQYQQSFANILDTIQREILGTTVMSVDNYWGAGKFMYVQFPASAAVTQGQLLTVSGFGGSAGYAAAVAPATANTGRQLYIAINAVANVASVQYGWVLVSGNAVVKTTASVVAGTTIGIDTATGGSAAANSAGRQLLGAVSVAASTFAVVKANVVTLNGSPVIRAQNVDGWFVGATMTGTGISGTIIVIDYDSRTVTLSANSTATGAVSATATYTGFLGVQIGDGGLYLQGAIT